MVDIFCYQGVSLDPPAHSVSEAVERVNEILAKENESADKSED